MWRSRSRNLYVIHEGDANKPDHPAIFVFDADGKYVRSFGKEFQGGGHGLEVHDENGEEFLYVTAYKALKKFAKLNLHGETVWERHAPMESGLYAAGEDTHPTNIWGRDRFHPTNIAFRPNSTDFYVADGYGAYVVHVYDQDANYKSTFGKPGPGTAAGQLDTPHGIWIDNRDVARAVHSSCRPSEWPAAMVHARWPAQGNARPLPAAGERGYVRRAAAGARFAARVTLLDGQNKVLAQFGDDEAWRAKVMKKKWPAAPREMPRWKVPASPRCVLRRTRQYLRL